MKKDVSIKILSFNIWGLPIWPINLKDRVVRIATYLKKLDADIICLQESFDVRHRDLIFKELASCGYNISDGGVENRERMLGRMDMTGGLVIFSKFPVVGSEFIPFKSWRYSTVEWLGRKGILEIIVETPDGPLRVINTHLYHGHSATAAKMRSQQLKSIVTISKKNDHIPTILAGDLNEDDAGAHDHLGILKENKFIHPIPAGERGMQPSYRIENPYVDNILNRKNKSMRYDYILTKNMYKYRLEVVSYEPLKTEQLLSDHDPVLMSLSRT